MTAEQSVLVEEPKLDVSDTAASVAEIYEEYREELIVHAAALLRSRDHAEDVVQQVFARTLSALGAGTKIDHPRRWLHRCVKNLCRDELRREGPLPITDALQLSTHQAVPEAAEVRQRCQAVQRAVHEMPEHWRSVFLLAELRGLTYREIADQLDRSVGSVRDLLYRVRQHLRDTVEGPGSLLAPPVVAVGDALARWRGRERVRAAHPGGDVGESLWHRLGQKLRLLRSGVQALAENANRSVGDSAAMLLSGAVLAVVPGMSAATVPATGAPAGDAAVSAAGQLAQRPDGHRPAGGRRAGASGSPHRLGAAAGAAREAEWMGPGPRRTAGNGPADDALASGSDRIDAGKRCRERHKPHSAGRRHADEQRERGGAAHPRDLHDERGARDRREGRRAAEGGVCEAGKARRNGSEHAEDAEGHGEEGDGEGADGDGELRDRHGGEGDSGEVDAEGDDQGTEADEPGAAATEPPAVEDQGTEADEPGAAATEPPAAADDGAGNMEGSRPAGQDPESTGEGSAGPGEDAWAGTDG